MEQMTKPKRCVRLLSLPIVQSVSTARIEQPVHLHDLWRPPCQTGISLLLLIHADCENETLSGISPEFGVYSN